MNVRRYKTFSKGLIFLLCLVLSFQWIVLPNVYAGEKAVLNPGAAHSSYADSSDPVQSNYGKGNYLYSTLTVTGDKLSKEKPFTEKVFSVKDLEEFAYQEGSNLGYEGSFSFKNSGGAYSNQTMTGIKLYDFLVSKCGMPTDLSDDTTVKCIAKDGYSNTLSIGNLKSVQYTYYDGSGTAITTGLPVMIGFGSGGLPLVGPTGDESTSKSFTASEGYNDTAQNSGGPLKITIGQTRFGDYNAMLNIKWLSRIVVGDDVDYTKHSGTDLTKQAIVFKTYQSGSAVPLKTKAYTLKQLEDFAGASSSSLAQNYYDGGSYYKGVNLWKLISTDTDLGLSSYDGSFQLKYSNGSDETIPLAYLQNQSGNYQTYITEKAGSTITCVKPILAYSINGGPTTDGAVLACLPSDGNYKETGTVKECTEISVYTGNMTYTHATEPYSQYIGQTVELTGSGIKNQGAVSLGAIEQNIAMTFHRAYTEDGLTATYDGIGLYQFLSSKKLTVDAAAVILSNGAEQVEIPLNSLQSGAGHEMLAFSRNNTPLVPNTGSSGYDAEAQNSGGPILFVSDGKYLENITSITVTAASGQWNHFDGKPDLYESYLDTAKIHIHGSQSNADTYLTLRQLEERSGDITRDSFASGGGSFGFEGIILKNLVDDYLKSGISRPSKVTVIGDGRYQKQLDMGDLYSGIESQYQPGETRDIILAYGVNGVPLVPGSDSVGYVDGINGFGTVRLIVENTVSAWVKGVSEIIIGDKESESGTVGYKVSYFKTKARSGNSDNPVPGLGYTEKTSAGALGTTVTIVPPVVPGWVFAGYDDHAGVVHKDNGAPVQLALSADESQNNISLRYNLNAGLLIAGDSLTSNYWYSYKELQKMAEKSTDYAALHSDDLYGVNLYSVVKRGGVPSDMFGAGLDFAKLLMKTGGTGSMPVSLYSLDGIKTDFKQGAFDFNSGNFADQGYYYYPNVLASGAGASETDKSTVRPMLTFRVNDIGWIYSNLDDKGAPTSSSELLDQPNLTEDVQPVQNRIQNGTENIGDWELSAAYPYPFLMLGQSSPSHFNNTDYFKMIHAITLGTSTSQLTIEGKKSTSACSLISFVKYGFEQVPFKTDQEGISLERFLTLSQISLASDEAVTFTGQASSVNSAATSTLGDYYIALNVDSSNKLDKANPFRLLHKSVSGIQSFSMSGLKIAAAETTDTPGAGGGGVGGAIPGTKDPVIPDVPLKVVDSGITGDSATAEKKIQSTTDKLGNALAKVVPGDIVGSLKDVVEARDKIGGSAIAEIKLSIDSAVNTNKLTVSLPADSLKNIASKENTQLTLSTKLGDLQLSGALLSEILKQSSGTEISVELSVADDSTVQGENQYPRGVFDLNISSAGKPITNFGSNKMTVSFPYKLADREKADGVSVYYLDGSGKSTLILNAQYDEATKKISFQTSHLSRYAIGYDENAIHQVFDDVTSSYWASGSIRFVAGKELFQGVGSTAFAPKSPMTRGMFVTVLSRLYGKDISKETANFNDVGTGQWYSNSVGWAANHKIVEGYAGQLFNPNQMVSREQMAAFLYRYAKWAGYDVKVSTSAGISSFSDSKRVSPWAEDALIWAVDKGLMSGVTASVLDPRGQATRAQVAEIIKRFSEKIIPVAPKVAQSSSDSSSGNSSAKSKNKYAAVPTGKPYLTVTGKGLVDTIYLTYDDLLGMSTVKITYTGRNKENDNMRQYLTYTGVNLNTIINAAGWKGEADTMMVNCSDGYTKRYKISEIMNDFVTYRDDGDTEGYWVPAIIAVLDKNTFRLVYGQEKSDTDTTMSFNMQGWANYLTTIEIY